MAIFRSYAYSTLFKTKWCLLTWGTTIARFRTPVAKPGDGTQTMSVAVTTSSLKNNKANTPATQTLSTSSTSSQLSSHRKWNAISDLQSLGAKHKLDSNQIQTEHCASLVLILTESGNPRREKTINAKVLTVLFAPMM